MTDDARKNTPEPPRLGMLVAVLLELCIVATFCANRSIVGVVLCVGYAWFSASWAFFAGRW